MEAQGSHPNRVSQFFANKTILITGATGFVGKVLVEKLLRSCSSLKKIYVIVRAKRGENPDHRLENLFKDPLFDTLRQTQGNSVFAKVVAISGDVAAPDLALTPENRKKLIQETEIVYHSAATVRFDECLKKTVLLNVRGTKLMLELAKECKKLQVFCYVSTAYCHENEKVVYEKLYPPPTNPHQLIATCKLMDEEVAECLLPEVRSAYANNYSFSKSVAESLIAEQMEELPVIIQRPSAIVPTWKEPIPGWTDNINGPIGMFIGAGKGVIRTMYAREDTFLNCYPVDCIVNGLILAAYDFCINGNRRIFNLGTTPKEAKLLNFTFTNFLNISMDIFNTKAAFGTVLWYPGGSVKQFRLLHYIHFFFCQLVPAVVLDGVLFIIGQKTFLLRVQKKVWKSYQIFELYVNREWNFQQANYEDLQKLLNPIEKEVFYTSLENFNLYEYLVQCILGTRRYILKEKDEDLAAAVKRIRIFRYIDMFCKCVIWVLVVYYLWKHFLYWIH